MRGRDYIGGESEMRGRDYIGGELEMRGRDYIGGELEMNGIRCRCIALACGQHSYYN